MKFLIIVAIFVSLLDNGDFRKRYDNYTLFRGTPQTDKQVEFLKELLDLYDVDYWKEPGLIKKPVEFIISPKDKDHFLRAAEGIRLPVTMLIDNIQRALDNQTVKVYTRRKIETFDWSSFYRLNDIHNWLKDLANNYPDIIKLIKIGTSFLDHKIYAVRLVFPKSERRSTVIVEGGIHAREWISPAFVTYMIDQILHAPDGKNENLKQIALTYEWYFIPNLNPDGYEYTHENDRMWRKNRRSFGVDLNRNFDADFGNVGVSWYRFSETYPGDTAFSEPETSAYAKFLRSKSNTIEYYLAFHSYGQYIIIPYAYSTGHWDNYETVKQMGLEAANKIRNRRNTKYSVGTAYDTVGYLCSGVSGCWAKKALNITYVVTFELPDNGRHGFALPPDRIRPTCEETMEGLTSFLTPRTEHFTKEPQLGALDSASGVILEMFVLLLNIFIIVCFG